MSSFSSLLCIKKGNKSVRISTKIPISYFFLDVRTFVNFRVKKPTMTSGRTGFDISLLSFSKESKSPLIENHRKNLKKRIQNPTGIIENQVTQNDYRGPF